MPALRPRTKAPQAFSSSSTSPSTTPTPTHTYNTPTRPKVQASADKSEKMECTVTPERHEGLSGLSNPMYSGHGGGESTQTARHGYTPQGGLTSGFAPTSPYGPSPISNHNNHSGPRFQLPQSLSSVSHGQVLPPLQPSHQSHQHQFRSSVTVASSTERGGQHTRPSLPSIGSLPGMGGMGYIGAPQNSMDGPRLISEGYGDDPSYRTRAEVNTGQQMQGAGATNTQILSQQSDGSYRAVLVDQHGEAATTAQGKAESQQAQPYGTYTPHVIQQRPDHPYFHGQQVYMLPNQSQYYHTQPLAQQRFVDPSTGRQIVVKQEPTEPNDTVLLHQQAMQPLPQLQLAPMHANYPSMGQQYNGSVAAGGADLQCIANGSHPFQQVNVQQPHPGRLVQPPMPWLERQLGRDEYGNAIGQDDRDLLMRPDGHYTQSCVSMPSATNLEEQREISGYGGTFPLGTMPAQRNHLDNANSSVSGTATRESYPPTPALSVENPHSVSNSRSTATPSPLSRSLGSTGLNGAITPILQSTPDNTFVERAGQSQAQMIWVKSEPQEDAASAYRMAYGQQQLTVAEIQHGVANVDNVHSGRNIYTADQHPSSMGFGHAHGHPGTGYLSGPGESATRISSDGDGLMVAQWRMQRSMASSASSSRTDSPASTNFSTSASYLSPGFGHTIYTDGSHSDTSRMTPLGTISPSTMFGFGNEPQASSDQADHGYHKSGLLRAMNLSDDTVSSSEGDWAPSQAMSPPNPISSSFMSGSERRITLPPIQTPPEMDYSTVRRKRGPYDATALDAASDRAEPTRKPTEHISALRTTTGEDPGGSEGSGESDEDDDEAEDERDNGAMEDRDEDYGTRAASPAKRRRLAPIKANAASKLPACRLPNPVPDQSVTKRPRGRVVAKDPAQVDSNVVHVCPMCSACFRRREHVKRHIRGLHTEEKPWPCKFPTCPKSFSRGDNLKAHYLAVHKVPATEVDAKIRAHEDHRPAVALRRAR